MRQSLLTPLLGVLTAGALALCLPACGKNPEGAKDDKAPSGEKPLSFKDEASGVLLYVETDRKHVAAIDKDGKILWHKEITQVVTLKSRGDKEAAVIFVGKPTDWSLKVMKERGKAGTYIGVGFNTKEFGVIDQQTGEYTSMGND
jgi:hypothetical protein